MWARIASPGAWWTGEERVAFAAEVRAAREKRADPPWLRGDAPPHDGPLPEAAVEVARRVAIDAHRLDQEWAERMMAALGDAAYVELVSLAVCVTAIDAFAESMGVPLEPLNMSSVQAGPTRCFHRMLPSTSEAASRN